MGRFGFFILLALGTLGIAWLLITAANFSGRRTLDRQLLLITVPLVLTAGLGGLAALFSSGFRRPNRSKPTALDRARAAVNTVTAVVVGLILTGLALSLYRLEREEPVTGFLVGIADFLVTPFRGVLASDSELQQISLNWGMGALAYAVVGLLLSAAVGALAERRRGRASG